MAQKTAILLLAHGSPEDPADVPAYMRNVTGGRPIPDSVLEEVKHRYCLIGTSPLTHWTIRQAQTLHQQLGIPVYVGMRNWAPYISETVKKIIADGVTQMVAICLAPQNSRTSVGLYKQATLAALNSQNLNSQNENPQNDNSKIKVEFVEEWHDHPLLVRAFAEKLTAVWQEACERASAKVPVIFTAHSVPIRTLQPSPEQPADPYETQAKETAAAVAALVPGLTEIGWSFAFQSQGISGDAWIGPTVEETITALHAARHRAVVMQPIGFVCDHVEVLYDIDIAFKQFAAQHDMQLWRAESLNDSPQFIAALADISRKTMERL